MEASGQGTFLVGTEQHCISPPRFPGVRAELCVSTHCPVCSTWPCFFSVRASFSPSLCKLASLSRLGVCRRVHLPLQVSVCPSHPPPLVCVCTHLCQLPSEFLFVVLLSHLGVCTASSPLLMCVGAPLSPSGYLCLQIPRCVRVSHHHRVCLRLCVCESSSPLGVCLSPAEGVCVASLLLWGAVSTTLWMPVCETSSFWCASLPILVCLVSMCPSPQLPVRVSE